MSKVRQTGDGSWIVATSYDGKRIAGPFETKGEAFAAQEHAVAAVVRSSLGHGFVVQDEDTGKDLAGPFPRERDAYAKRDEVIEAAAAPAPAPAKRGKKAGKADVEDDKAGEAADAGDDPSE